MAKRIDMSNLNIYYGNFHAVEDVSMTVEPRTVTAFIGPSGCGKSTVLRTINRMHEVIPGAHVKGSDTSALLFSADGFTPTPAVSRAIVVHNRTAAPGQTACLFL